MKHHLIHYQMYPPHAIPILWQNTFDMYSSEQTENKILPIFAQVLYDYPLILIYHSSHTTFRVN